MPKSVSARRKARLPKRPFRDSAESRNGGRVQGACLLPRVRDEQPRCKVRKELNRAMRADRIARFFIRRLIGWTRIPDAS